jgi:hypothetical protein
MHKGQLVNPIDNKSVLKPGPYIIVRGPYEFSTMHIVQGRKINHLIRCVDLLDPRGSIVKHVSCDILEKV